MIINRDNERDFFDVQYSEDIFSFFTRDSDDSVRLWDMRKFEKYVWKIEDIKS